MLRHTSFSSSGKNPEVTERHSPSSSLGLPSTEAFRKEAAVLPWAPQPSSIREYPGTMQRKLISTASICNLVFSLMTTGERNIDWPLNQELFLSFLLYHSGPIRQPLYYRCCTDSSVNLTLHPSLAPKQSWRRPTYTGNRSDLLPAMNQSTAAVTQGPKPRTLRATLTEHLGSMVKRLLQLHKAHVDWLNKLPWTVWAPGGG